jgi:hypothetical protein
MLLPEALAPGALLRPCGWLAAALVAAADDGAPLKIMAWRRRPSRAGRG